MSGLYTGAVKTLEKAAALSNTGDKVLERLKSFDTQIQLSQIWWKNRALAVRRFNI